jgi:hypothetical protein
VPGKGESYLQGAYVIERSGRLSDRLERADDAGPNARVFGPRSGCWSLVDPHPCVESHLPFAHDGALSDAESVRSLEFLNALVFPAATDQCIRYWSAQRQVRRCRHCKSAQRTRASRLASPNKKRAARTRRKALPPSGLAARRSCLTPAADATEMRLACITVDPVLRVRAVRSLAWQSTELARVGVNTKLFEWSDEITGHCP